MLNYIYPHGVWKLIAEFTNEQIVTQLLSSNEILKPENSNFYIKNPGVSLGDYLLNVSKDIKKTSNVLPIEDSKYVFIKM